MDGWALQYFPFFHSSMYLVQTTHWGIETILEAKWHLFTSHEVVLLCWFCWLYVWVWGECTVSTLSFLWWVFVFFFNLVFKMFPLWSTLDGNLNHIINNSRRANKYQCGHFKPHYQKCSPICLNFANDIMWLKIVFSLEIFIPSILSSSVSSSK